jgi:hypothetical protein
MDFLLKATGLKKVTKGKGDVGVIPDVIPGRGTKQCRRQAGQTLPRRRDDGSDVSNTWTEDTTSVFELRVGIFYNNHI